MAPVLVGVLACVAATTVADQPLKVLFYRAAAVGLIVTALQSAYPKRILLFFWAATLTYNRNYFVDALGNHGSYGLYWSPADVFLAALLGLWAFEAIVQKRAPVAKGLRLWPWFLPFAAACVISMVVAEHPEWAAFELTRVLRVALIFAYVRCNVRREEFWACIAGLAVAILLQSALSVQYVVTGRRFGVTAVLGLSPGGERLQAATSGVDANLGFRRGEGTFGHPNTLAIYGLLVGPLFVALGLAAKESRTRLVAGAAGLAAIGAVASALSRTSWVITAGQLFVLVILLLLFARVSARRMLGLAAVVALAGSLVLAPLLPRIQQRFFGNFSDSVDFRLRHNAIALEIWSGSPVFGIGLGNYSNTLSKYDLEEVTIFLDLGEEVRTALGIRATAWVHNMYLLMLSETGLVGLAGFVIFLAGGLITAARGAWRASGDVQLVSIGLIVGMLGVYVHGLQESALWIDPILYSYALAVGLAAVAIECSSRGYLAPRSIREVFSGAPSGRPMMES